VSNARRRTLIIVFVIAELVIVGLMFRSIGFSGYGRGTVSMASAGIPADVHTTIATSLRPHVVIDDDDATIVVRGTSGTSVRVDEQTVVRGTVRGIRGLHVERTSDGVRIDRGGEEHVTIMFGELERTLTVSVPEQTQLDIVAADEARVEGLRADASIHAIDGGITVNDHRGSLDVRGDDGRVLLSNIEGASVSVKNSDGDVELSRVHTPSLDVHTDDGGIVGRNLSVDGGMIGAGDGKVDLHFAAGNNLTIETSTSDGHLDVVPPLVMSPGSGDDEHHSIRIGNGGGHLDVTTSDGRITIAAESAITGGV
jgi:hypothetical protein